MNNMQEHRWTLHKVVTSKGFLWTYELRNGAMATRDWSTSKAAAKAAERAWRHSK